VSVSKRGFPGLDGLRFYAALGVAITHAEQVASWASVANVYPLVSTLGDTCVSGFFVLSGFLITDPSPSRGALIFDVRLQHNRGCHRGSTGRI
jgi:peptidoglycan/LPS O-acetylase OafA/YrhL